MKKKEEQYIFINDCKQIDGVRVGHVATIDENGRVFVNYSGNKHGHVAARFTSSVKLQSLREALSSKQEVLLAFENNDPLRPIIIDTISSLTDEVIQTAEMDLKGNELDDVTVNGNKITFDAKEEIVLRCDKASITLRKDGRIVVKGTNLTSRASKNNKIKGASVQIN